MNIVMDSATQLPGADITQIQATVVGIVHQSPQLRYTKADAPVGNAQLVIAGKDDYAYVRVSMFGKRAEDIFDVDPATFDVGSAVMATGQLSQEWYTGQDGKIRSSLQIVASSVTVLTPADETLHEAIKEKMQALKDARESGAAAAPGARNNRTRRPAQTAEPAAPVVDDVPF